ncbi:transglutaminase domain-containing protein [Hymenobacter busanensis]|uniref:Transglutaminase domain-containing protein n=1 Tax=Hymenobacter busanensis TaxID=2607656 RepID=A0A7L4ZU78_9BACT|nr:transglutaminase-like domain-containing protein [Hymenobacter busanensis]KAA9339274.1 transglutaminase domain-containing protein [Hymenobacter busanensis]QHJ06964.1 transglutaminase domain-containing protein [Hymenobacter busanensis]
MKPLLLGSLLLIGGTTFAQSTATYQGLPVIKAHELRADYRLGREWVKGNWRIAPEASPDVLILPLHTAKETLVFRTDHDSIRYTLAPGNTQRFYVLLDDGRYALTELRATAFTAEPLRFDTKAPAAAFPMQYEAGRNNAYLAQLRQQYHLDAVVQGARNDTERALRLLHWVHQQWDHNGENQPTKSDALSILEEVKQGKQFRCVEYGIVATSCLNAFGLKSRVLGLKTKDVETTESGAGHVLLETWLPDLQKWVLLDGQWDVMPVLKGKPLNAVEFQQAIVSNYKDLEISSLSGASKMAYVSWITPYLYYLDVKFDNREGVGLERAKVNGKSSLMLVPAGAKEPTVFQVKNPITYCHYTHSVAAFYAKPE